MYQLVCQTGFVCDQSTSPDTAGNSWVELGKAGVDGATGPQGERGATGSQGLQGATGANGLDGKTGSQGRGSWQGLWDETRTFQEGDQVKWSVNSQLLTWQLVCEPGNACRYGQPGQPNNDWVLLGTEGPQGITGTQGERGEQGLNGTNGIAGERGATGAQGITGIQGERGFNGTTGERGATGVQGERGVAGFNGTAGAQGPAIYKGSWSSTLTYVDGDITKHHSHIWFLHCNGTCVNGVPGFYGTSWELMHGQDGQDGSDGNHGATGATGVQGLAGQDGQDGRDGLDGRDGQNGLDGSGSGTGDNIMAMIALIVALIALLGFVIYAVLVRVQGTQPSNANMGRKYNDAYKDSLNAVLLDKEITLRF